MDPRTTRQFAQFIEDETFDSPARAGLLADLRAGVFAADKLVNPWISLKVALGRIDAPAAVLAELERLRAAHAKPVASPLSDEELAAAAAAAVSVPRFVRPSVEPTVEQMMNLIVPDGKLVEALSTGGVTTQ